MTTNFDGSGHRVEVHIRNRPPTPWRWEIYCDGRASVVEYSKTSYRSQPQCAEAGADALARLLDRLGKKNDTAP